MIGPGAVILINGSHYETVFLRKNTEVRGLVPGFVYTIEVIAFYLGRISATRTFLFEAKDIMPPSVPENLSVKELAPDSVTLTWDESTDDVGVLEYVIYNNNEYFDSTPMTRYTAVDLVPNTYSFTVCAVDLSGNVSGPASIPVEIKGLP
jgi:hypothetical protein